MNIPNLLSLFRLGLVPVFAVLFFQPTPNARYWAAAIYTLAILTDIADGYIARHFNQITRLGRILDPLADKLMTFTVIICITMSHMIPVWAVVVVFCKEAAMGLGALSLYRKVDDIITANYMGKASTAIFFVVCAALVLFPSIPRGRATCMISVALVFTIAAFLVYLWQYLHILRKRNAKETQKNSQI